MHTSSSLFFSITLKKREPTFSVCSFNPCKKRSIDWPVPYAALNKRVPRDCKVNKNRQI